MTKRYTEFQSCCALMQWWSFYSRINKLYEGLLFHCPNQSAGGVKNGKNLQRMGVRKGQPDYMLAFPRNGFHGLFLEMKSEEGKLSPEQKTALSELAKQGYKTETCYSTDAARSCIESYLKPL